MRRVNILHTIETSGPGGAETIFLQLVKGLDAERYGSLVVINEAGWLADQLTAAGIPTICVDWKKWYDFKLIREMMALIDANRIDIIHSHLPDQNFYSCIAGKLAGCDIVATYHGLIEMDRSETTRGRMKFEVVKWAASKVVAVCESGAARLRSMGVPPGKLEMIFNGVDTRAFSLAQRDHGERGNGVCKESILIGMIANIRETKGHEYFIRAAREIADAYPSASFVVCGDLHERLGPPLFQLVKALRLESKLTFLGFRRNIREILAGLDVFVLPSTSEGMPLALLEAMSCGVPIVSTRCGGPQEIIKDGVTGHLVRTKDAHEIAMRVLDILKHKNRGRGMGLAARDEIVMHWSVPSMIEKYDALYAKVIERE